MRRTAFGSSSATSQTWSPPAPVDVIVSNATLQWVPGHRRAPATARRRARARAAGSPSRCRATSRSRATGCSASWPPTRASQPRPPTSRSRARTTPSDYLADLAALGCAVDAWETTYLHVLAGADPVFRWISGTGARPVLQALDGPLLDEFVAEYKAPSARGVSSAGRWDGASVPPRLRASPAGHELDRPLIIRDARPDDLEAVIALLDEDAIREVVEDYSDLTPYADGDGRDRRRRRTRPCWSASSTARSSPRRRSPGSAG